MKTINLLNEAPTLTFVQVLFLSQKKKKKTWATLLKLVKNNSF